MQTEEPERKSKQFWAENENGDIVFVTGWECPPNDEVWWVPELGWSGSEKFSLFDTKVEALEPALIRAQKRLAAAEKQVLKLRAEKARLSDDSIVPAHCNMCGTLMAPEDNCGGNCVYCMALLGDPECVATVKTTEASAQANIQEKLDILRQAVVNYLARPSADGKPVRQLLRAQLQEMCEQ